MKVTHTCTLYITLPEVDIPGVIKQYPNLKINYIKIEASNNVQFDLNMSKSTYQFTSNGCLTSGPPVLSRANGFQIVEASRSDFL